MLDAHSIDLPRVKSSLSAFAVPPAAHRPLPHQQARANPPPPPLRLFSGARVLDDQPASPRPTRGPSSSRSTSRTTLPRPTPPASSGGSTSRACSRRRPRPTRPRSSSRCRLRRRRRALAALRARASACAPLRRAAWPGAPCPPFRLSPSPACSHPPSPCPLLCPAPHAFVTHDPSPSSALERAPGCPRSAWKEGRSPSALASSIRDELSDQPQVRAKQGREWVALHPGAARRRRRAA